MQSNDLMSLLLYLASQPVSGSGGGGSGGTSVYISSCVITEDGDLVTTLSDGTVINAGKCKGDKGDKGEKGETGSQGIAGEKGETGEAGADGISPTISVVANTTSVYQLKITNADGSSFITPNLIGAGSTTKRYYIFDNALHTNYTEKIYTVFNNTLKSLQEYIDEGKTFCNESTNYVLNYNTNDFGWSGAVTTFNTVPMSLSSSQYVLIGYSTSALKENESIKLIPSNLVTGSTDLEKAQSIQSVLASGSTSIQSIDLSYEYSPNGVTEAISLSSIQDGDYYFVWTSTSDNSVPKISDITVM